MGQGVAIELDNFVKGKPPESSVMYMGAPPAEWLQRRDQHRIEIKDGRMLSSLVGIWHPVACCVVEGWTHSEFTNRFGLPLAP